MENDIKMQGIKKDIADLQGRAERGEISASTFRRQSSLLIEQLRAL